MARLHLFEITDQDWCPDFIRNSLTDALQSIIYFGNHYGRVVSRIRKALDRLGTRRVIDLGSGGGGPWLRLHREFEGAAELYYT